MPDRVLVPCNGCRACCKNESVVLYPEYGDDVGSYETMPALGPTVEALGLENRVMLKRKPNGDCHYLNETGCTIYDRAPAMCQEFDCRKWYLKFNRQVRKRLERQGYIGKELMDAARARIKRDRPA